MARKNRLNPRDRLVTTANEQELRYLDSARSKHIMYKGQVTLNGPGDSELYRWLHRAETLVDEVLSFVGSLESSISINLAIQMKNRSRMMRGLESLIANFNLCNAHISKLKHGEICPKAIVVFGALKELEPCDPLESALIGICKNSRSEWFKKAVFKTSHRSHKNINSQLAYWESLLGKFQQLQVVRVDLYYPPARSSLIEAASAQSEFDKLLLWLRRTKSPKVGTYAGFAMRREHGLARGMHFRLMAAFRTPSNLTEEAIADEIGRNWVGRFGESADSEIADASYFHPYSGTDRYILNGVGLVRVADERAKIRLRVAIEAMCEEAIRFTPDICTRIGGDPKLTQVRTSLGTKNLRSGQMTPTKACSDGMCGRAD
jgi:hypothetical protein